jgi:hypothetical protein
LVATEAPVLVTLANAASDDHSPTYRKYFRSRGGGKYRECATEDIRAWLRVVRIVGCPTMAVVLPSSGAQQRLGRDREAIGANLMMSGIYPVATATPHPMRGMSL